MAIMGPEDDQLLDEYCTGYVFGLEGSKMMVNIANKWHSPANPKNIAKGVLGSIVGSVMGRSAVYNPAASDTYHLDEL